VVLYSAAAALARALRDLKDEAAQQRRALRARMAASKSYFEWSIHAAKLDALGDGRDQEARWRQETRLYDRRLLEEKAAHLRAVRASGAGVAEQMFAVRADLMRNLGNITNSALHEHFPVVPAPIRDYIDEVKAQLEQVTRSPALPPTDRAAFLKETRHAFGRTALVLSGGGPLGCFHLGVVRALLEHRLLPRVLLGSSVGAVVAAVVATRTDAELAELLADPSALRLDFFSTATAAQALGRALRGGGGAAADAEALVARLRPLLGDLTFLEAYASTGRVLNLSVSAADTQEPPRLLNYLTAPHVLVWSAVACSSAFPGLYAPQDLLARTAAGELVRFGADAAAAAGGKGGAGGRARPRRWRDGSLEEELPMRGLSEMFSVNHFIVSQTVPHVVPLLNLKRRLGTAGQLGEAELKHRCRQAAELLPAWAPRRWLRSISQPWEGDVTIVPPAALAQLRAALAPPAHAALVAAVRQGELSTWAKLSAIQCNCGVEATLDACIQEAATRERLDRRAAQPLKARCPTVHAGLAAMGLCAAASSDSLAPCEEGAAPAAPSGAHDGVWEPAEEHLPLPEERRLGPPPRRRAVGFCAYAAAPARAAFECTDASANALASFAPGGASPRAAAPGGSEDGAAARRGARRSLDVVAP
jgi:TAG lipase/steryl ester hydrolase/phospholipase A2/LPA acyltransferase